MTQIEIKAVACLRGNIIKGLSYDAEIATGIGEHHLIGSNFSTREEALAAAQPIVNKLNTQLQQLISMALKCYPTAKP